MTVRKQTATAMERSYREVSTGKRRTCAGCLARIIVRGTLLLLLVAGFAVLSFFVFPPFGHDRVARVLLIGLDDEPRGGGGRRSDTIILTAARLDGSGSLLLSVPRDARVRIPAHGTGKINAAYTYGGVSLLQQTLGQPRVLQAELPYYLVFDSDTVRAVVDAFGGVEVDVPFRMKYDDHWGNLHIDLHPGKQVLNGEQAVGYLRWRKNNTGRGSDDFERGARQREVLAALAAGMKSGRGLLRAPAVYGALRAHTTTNLTTRQFLALGWSLRGVRSETVPGGSYLRGGVSYVQCDWEAGRATWEAATR